MSERILAAALVWTLVGCALVRYRKASPLHLVVLGLVSTGLVATFYPVASLFVDPLTWRNGAHAASSTVARVQLDYLAFTLGLAVAVGSRPPALARRESRAASPPGSSGSWVRTRDALVPAFLVLGGGAIYSLYVLRVGLEALTDRYDYAAKYKASFGLGYLSFGLWMMVIACLWAEGSRTSRATRLAFRALALAIAVWSVGFISVRTNAVVLGAGYLYLACARRGIELRRLRPGLVALLAVAWLGLEGFSLYRGTTSRSVGEALQTIVARGQTSVASVVGGSELSHPFLTAVEVHAANEPGALGGESYLNSLRVLAPKALYPDRPLTLSERFVRSHYADFAARGAGTAFSLVGEAWLNFGSGLAPLLAGAAFGACLVFLERRRATRPDGVLARLVPYLAFLVIVAHRNESASLLKHVFTSVVVVTLACWAAELVHAGTRRSASAAGEGRTGSEPAGAR